MAFPYEELFFRNRGTISAKEQRTLRTANVAIIGLGGTGGFALENLVRAGVENFVLFDPDRFELSNFNRQLLSNVKNIDGRKTTAAGARIMSINPDARIAAHGKRFAAKDWKLLKEEGCDIVLDCSDNIATRHEISDACVHLKIPFVFSSASFSRGMVSVFMPGVKFKKVFGFTDGDKEFASCRSVICPAPALAGTLTASQAMNYLLGKPVVCAPEFIFFDVFSKEILWKKRL